MFIFRYSKTTHVYYQNFLKENKHCKFSISFLLTIHEILSNSNKKHFRVRACACACARKITQKTDETVVAQYFRKFT